MAKIYETNDDLKRDQLQSAADAMKLKSSRQDYWALSLLGGGLVSSLYSDRGVRPRTGLKYLATGLTVAGIVEWVRSWGTSSKAGTLELQSKLTGTGQVIIPAAADHRVDRAIESGNRGNWKEAQALYEAAYAAAPGNPNITNGLGIASVSLGEPEKAAGWYNKTLEIVNAAPAGHGDAAAIAMNGLDIANAKAEKDCGCHLKHEKPRSLLEYAAKSGGMDIGKS